LKDSSLAERITIKEPPWIDSGGSSRPLSAERTMLNRTIPRWIHGDGLILICFYVDMPWLDAS
jgi:hypothetical protein